MSAHDDPTRQTDPDVLPGQLAAPKILDATALPSCIWTCAALSSISNELDLHRVEVRILNDDLRRAEQALADSERRYRLLFEDAPVAYLDLDAHGTIEEANVRAGRLLGTKPNLLRGQALDAFMQQEDADDLHRHLALVMSGDEGDDCDLVLAPTPETRVAVHLESVAVRDDLDAVIGCRTIVHDRSQFLGLRDRLRSSQARSAAVLDTVTDAVITVDARGRIESLNQATERMLGYADIELLGLNVRMLVADTDAESLEQRLRLGKSLIGELGAAPSHTDAVGRRKNGETFPLTLDLGAWSDEGEPKFTLVLRDVSSRARRAKALMESEKRFRQIAEHVTDGFFVHERIDRSLSYVSPAFESILGRAAEDIVANDARWISWVHTQDRDRVRAAYNNLFAGRSLDETFRIIRPTGEHRWVRIRTFPVEESDHSVPLDIGVMQDITERRKLEEALQHTRKMEAVGALATGVAHDFGNVLQGVLGCLVVSQAEGTSPELARELLDRASAATRRGGDLASRLMKFSRKHSHKLRSIHVDSLFWEIVPVLRRLVTEQVEVVFEPGAPGAFMLADPVQIEQILMNLGANARDSMPSGGTLHISTSVHVLTHSQPNRTGVVAPGEYVRWTVRDTGTGMDKMTLERAFEPFYTTKKMGDGTGLGLATVFSVTQQLEGHVDLGSSPGAGTTLTFLFPAVQTVEEAKAPTSSPKGFTGRALLVEDNALVRISVSHYLRGLGFDVVEAKSAAEALDQLDAAPIDVAVTDVNLPDTRGPRLTDMLRRRIPDLPVLYITASPSLVGSADVDQPNTSVLEKPFGRDELGNHLEKLLKN